VEPLKFLAEVLMENGQEAAAFKLLEKAENILLSNENIFNEKDKKMQQLQQQSDLPPFKTQK